MSGHSKWSTIKRKKGALDAKRGKIFTKLVREITTAARLSGGDPDANPRLRVAIAAGKSGRVPSDTITRAIKKGTGELEGAIPEEGTYEGYGPGGVAFFVEVQTDNKNRTAADVRAAFHKHNGNLGQPGSVAYMFHKQGIFLFDANQYTEEEIMDAALTAGADDVKMDDGNIEVTCSPTTFVDVLNYFEKTDLHFENAEITMTPDTLTKVASKEAEQVLRLMERLDDLDDVQKVYANFDIDDATYETFYGSLGH